MQETKLFDGKFNFNISNHLETVKLNQIFQTIKNSLENILVGYSYPEPYFRDKLKTNVEKLFSILHDPSLPLLEIEDILSNISDRMPKVVDQEIKKLMKNYRDNLTSVLVQFPSQAIASIIDNYAAKLEQQRDRDLFLETIQSLVQLVQRYRYGIKEHMKAVVADLIRSYLNIEKLFQNGHYDKCLTQLRDQHKIAMHKVAEIVFSHANYNSKNALIIMLIDFLFERNPIVTDDLATLLNELTLLRHVNNSKVALKARQVLIVSEQPPYELRHIQMESIFLSAMNMYGHQLCEENIQVEVIEQKKMIYFKIFFISSNLEINFIGNKYVRCFT